MILDENFFSSDWQERLQWNFLWGEEFKHHLVGWNRVCSPLTSGGLGIRKLATFNQSLLDKWLWWFRLVGDQLWRQVITAKYGKEWGMWHSKPVQGSLGCGLWKSIRMRGDLFFYSAFGLRWALIVKSDSGTIVGVRINLQRWGFQCYFKLHWIRILLWKLCWRDIRWGQRSWSVGFMRNFNDREIDEEFARILYSH